MDSRDYHSEPSSSDAREDQATEVGAQVGSGDCGDLKPIPTPDEVEVVTGEEDEEIVFFAERARVYRFVIDEKRYVERGTGPLKILQSPTSKKARVVMRKGIARAVCLNFPLTSKMELADRGNQMKNALQLTCLDFSESAVGVLMILCFRFKTDNESAEFKKAFEASVAQLSN